MTLIVDALDEDTTNVNRVKKLRQLLERYPRLHCVVAGRPVAVNDRYWADLLSDELLTLPI
ncbi:hypothetical protein [Novipirellula maiorica]|uniref:hypothetical protein n=1 Tax=Novipirellula maiorica TaxID=1265734 RepID=UPI000593B221|nr:hypothetical protein [Rhodopirellula maiorica]